MEIKSISDIKNMFFRNASVKQTILKNTFWMGSADAVAKILRLVLLVYVAKILGPTEYGEFTFAFAFVYLFAVFADLGVGEILIREFARDGEKEKEFPSIVSLKLFANLFTIFLVFVSSFFITASSELQKLIWILLVYLLIDSFFYLICCFFRARQEMQYEAFAKIFQTLVLLGAGFYMLFNFPSAEALSYVYVFAALASLLFFLAIFLIKNNSFKIEWDKAIWKKYLLMSWPLAMVSALTMIYNQIDSVMMGYWQQITETGWYNASYRIVGATFIINGLIATVFYPSLSKYFNESKDMLQRVWGYQMKTMIFLAVPLFVIGTMFAPDIINLIYGTGFGPSILVFQLLIVMAGIAYLQTPFNHILIATNQQKKLFWAILLGTVLNIILNLILIPKYSLYGAAATTMFTWLTLLLVCMYFTYRYTPIKFWNRELIWSLALAGISGLAMFLSIGFLSRYEFNFIIPLLVGGIIYIISFYLLFTIKTKLCPKTKTL